MSFVLVKIYRPVYTCLVVDNLKEFICGTGNGLLIFTIDKRMSLFHCCNVVHSSLFDGQIIVYDTCGKLDPTTRILLKIPRAHDGIISCLVKAHNVYDHQKLVISGSFDRHVKIWNDEGQLMHLLNNTILSFIYDLLRNGLFDVSFQLTIGIAHIPTTDTFWVTSGSCHARIFDVQTGEDVSVICNN
ncbi:uncharacterized protein DC041_0009344 [Schistosoma bovis]|uniref:Uncharacterized protein n=1 Tax=Schistosoma bovis TaxID=6184 RepID=A0A430QU80_SCHBO|nr:uncharacterized protein DC041_0009344 [Schistosoma bovis]